jgi:predicted nuclease of predicted toxin-antitoxin system
MPRGVQRSARFHWRRHEAARRYESLAAQDRLSDRAWDGSGPLDGGGIGYGSLDTEIMTYARVHSYVILTHDLDFGAILAATQGAKPSVIQIRAELVGPDAIGTEILAVLEQLRLELEAGALVTVDPKRTRVRVLPLYGRG